MVDYLQYKWVLQKKCGKQEPKKIEGTSLNPHPTQTQIRCATGGIDVTVFTLLKKRGGKKIATPPIYW